MDIGYKIKKIRKSKGMLQRELAKKADVSRVAIVNYERGERTPSATILSKIADALGVNIKVLTTDKTFTQAIVHYILSNLKDSSYPVQTISDHTQLDYKEIYDIAENNKDTLPIEAQKKLLEYLNELNCWDFKELYVDTIYLSCYDIDNVIREFMEELIKKEHKEILIKLGTSDTYINDEGKISHVFSKKAFDETTFGTKDIATIRLLIAYIGRIANEKGLVFLSGEDIKFIMEDANELINADLERVKAKLGTKID